MPQREVRWPQLAGYEIMGRLGSGAMGAVFLARQKAVNRMVAIKCTTATGRRGTDDAKRLRREAKVLAKLDHENIVRVVALVSDQEGSLCLVLELVDGPTLQDVMGRLSVGMALDCIRSLCFAIDYAGERSVVHRDIKPANVLITRSGVCKLADFGIVRLIERGLILDESARLTREGGILGTGAYMSPEAARGARHIGPPADVYSLGVLAYEMLVGRRPFQTETFHEAIGAHLSKVPDRPERVVTTFPARVGAVLLSALEKDPRSRPSALQYWTSLECEASAAWPHWRQEASLAGLAATASPLLPSRPGRSLEEDTAAEGSDADATTDQRGGDTMLAPAARDDPATPRRREPRNESAGRQRSTWTFSFSMVRRRLVLLAFAPLVALAVLAGVVRAAHSPPEHPLVVVERISLSVAPGPEGHCPTSDFLFRAEVLTNGAAGSISYAWEREDGTSIEAGTQAVRAGVSKVVQTLRFNVSGGGSQRGSVVFHVVLPPDVYSPPRAYDYRCP